MKEQQENTLHTTIPTITVPSRDPRKKTSVQCPYNTNDTYL
jgi:hypothetical protein